MKNMIVMNKNGNCKMHGGLVGDNFFEGNKHSLSHTNSVVNQIVGIVESGNKKKRTSKTDDDVLVGKGLLKDIDFNKISEKPSTIRFVF